MTQGQILSLMNSGKGKLFIVPSNNACRIYIGKKKVDVDAEIVAELFAKDYVRKGADQFQHLELTYAGREAAEGE